MTGKASEYEIAPACWPQDTEQARGLLTNYGKYLASSPSGAAGVCIPGYESELRGLPGKYAEEEADLLWRGLWVKGRVVSRLHEECWRMGWMRRR